MSSFQRFWSIRVSSASISLGAAQSHHSFTAGDSTKAAGVTLRRPLLVVMLNLLLAVGLCIPSVAQTPAVYDAFTGFSFVSNPTPDGVWSYGHNLGLGQALNLYTFRDTEFDLSIWENPGSRDPNVIKNETASEITVFGQILFPTTDFLHFHPGPNGELSVIRWTAPTSGSYQLDATFRSLRVAGSDTTTSVHIFQKAPVRASPPDRAPLYRIPVFGGHILFTGSIDSNDDVLNFTTVIKVDAGDSIDFAVDAGPNGNYDSDSTGIRVRLTVLD